MHRTALWATVGVILVLGVTILSAGQLSAATRSITGRGAARGGADADAIRVDFLQTVPNDEKLNGETAELKVTSSARIVKNIGQTKIGGKIQPVKTKRIRPQNVEQGSEGIFFGTYTPEDKNSVRVRRGVVLDRSFSVCGKLQGITRRTAAGANSNTLTVEVSSATVQEKRYERFFPLKKDALFAFGDGTQFHNAAGTLAKPHGRVSIQAADVTASQQTIGLHGKITGGSTLEVTTADLGVKCS